MKFKPNFSSIKGEKVMIVHHSTSSTIELTIFSQGPDDKEQNIWLEYNQLDSLIDVIKSIENDEIK